MIAPASEVDRVSRYQQCNHGRQRPDGLLARNRETVMVASEGRLVVTIDMRESCLLVYPLNEWETVQAKLEGLSNINPQARLLQRLLIGHATDLELDSARPPAAPGHAA